MQFGMLELWINGMMGFNVALSDFPQFSIIPTFHYSMGVSYIKKSTEPLYLQRLHN
jgi:hypothetical protein